MFVEKITRGGVLQAINDAVSMRIRGFLSSNTTATTHRIHMTTEVDIIVIFGMYRTGTASTRDGFAIYKRYADAIVQIYKYNLSGLISLTYDSTNKELLLQAESYMTFKILVQP